MPVSQFVNMEKLNMWVGEYHIHLSSLLYKEPSSYEGHTNTHILFKVRIFFRHYL